jgi:hypothetical protein
MSSRLRKSHVMVETKQQKPSGMAPELYAVQSMTRADHVAGRTNERAYRRCSKLFGSWPC